MRPQQRAALLVMVMLSATAGCADEATPTESATRAPSRSAASATSSTSGPASEPDGAFLDGLSPGPPPRIGYVDGDEYVAPDGTRTRIPIPHGISAIVPYRGGFLISDTRYFEGTNGLAFVDQAGRTTELRPCASGGARLSWGGESVAWATFACPESGVPGRDLMYRADARDDSPATIQDVTPRRHDTISVVGLLGQDVVYSIGIEGGVFATDLIETPRRVDGLVHASSLDEVGARVSGRLPGSSDFGGAVVQLPAGEALWQRDDVVLGPFSPRGARLPAAVVTQPDCQSRHCFREVVLDAATGQELLELEGLDALGGYASDLVWEDEQHLLGVLSRGRKEAVVRVGLDGDVELVLPPARAQLGRAHYVLATTP